MIVHAGYENLRIINPVVTLGIFDGVHKGHKSILSSLVRKASDVGGESVVITFYPPPRLVLSGNTENLYFLSSREEKAELLSKEGVSHLITIPFDHELSNKEACEFISEVLVSKVGTKYLIAGFNTNFGKKSEGGFDNIRRCAESFGILVEQINALENEGVIISSSKIREALQRGELGAANRMLGYDYFINGVVVEGKHLGKKLGFPTANIEPGYKHKLVPGDGVYAVEIIFEGSKYKGMLSVGSNPTVNDDPGKRTIEVNIFSFGREIYGEQVSVIFRFRLRDEIKFENLDLLKEQLELDKKMTLGLLDE